jgi:hypothetical protein
MFYFLSNIKYLKVVDERDERCFRSMYPATENADSDAAEVAGIILYRQTNENRIGNKRCFSCQNFSNSSVGVHDDKYELNSCLIVNFFDLIDTFETGSFVVDE